MDEARTDHSEPSRMSPSSVLAPASPSAAPLDASRQTSKAAKKKSVIRRAAVACVACRDRKIKCDGNPDKRGESCLQCKHLSRPCEFRFDDRRKKSSTSKEYVKHLEERIAALQRGQRSSSTVIVDSPNQSEGLNNDSVSKFNEAYRDFSAHGPAQTISDTADTSMPKTSMIKDPEPFPTSISNYQIMDWHFDTLERNTAQTTNNQTVREGVAKQSIEARNHMITQLYGAMGLLDADEPGQLTNIHITSVLAPSSPESFEIVPLELEELADSKLVQAELLDLYFVYEDPLLQVLQREPFMSDYAVGCKTQYYSKFLLYSVLLNSLRLSNDSTIRSLDRIYLARAKQELVSELENPTIAAIQALCIFADYRGAGLGNDKACLIYPGIAFRMLLDLALTRDATDLMAMGYLSERDLQVRHNVFWGCYVYDKLHSIYLGRPVHITLADVTVPRLANTSRDPQSQIRTAYADLCTIMGDVIDLVNGPLHLPNDQSANASRSRFGQRLLHWVKGLPVEVQWRPEEENIPLPGVYALHMQFYATIIMLHRPCAAYTTVSPDSGASVAKQNSFNTPALSQKLCHENAIRVARLLLSYRQHYGIKRAFSSMLHTIFVAATTLISHISTSPYGKEQDENKKWLAVCLQGLSDLGPCFHLAGRVHKVIASYIEGCGYAELTHLANTESIDQQQRHLENENRVRRQSYSLYPTNADHENVSETENISDTTLAVNEFDLYHAMSSQNAQSAGLPVAGGLERLLNMDSYQMQSVFPDFENTGTRTPQLDINFLCT